MSQNVFAIAFYLCATYKKSLFWKCAFVIPKFKHFSENSVVTTHRLVDTKNGKYVKFLIFSDFSLVERLSLR